MENLFADTITYDIGYGSKLTMDRSGTSWVNSYSLHLKHDL